MSPEQFEVLATAAESETKAAIKPVLERAAARARSDEERGEVASAVVCGMLSAVCELDRLLYESPADERLAALSATLAAMFNATEEAAADGG